MIDNLGLAEPPAEVMSYFGAAADRAVAYVQLLATVGVERGLIGPGEVPRLWDRHLLNCAVVEELIPVDAAVDDVGSGAGLPGIVLALRRPDLRITLVEPLLRRATFLGEAVGVLGLSSVTVDRSRAEDRARRARPGSTGADVVTARAVAPLQRLVGWAMPLIRPGGELLAIKGDRAEQELIQAGDAIREAGGVDACVVRVGLGIVKPETTVVRIVCGLAPSSRTTHARRSA